MTNWSQPKAIAEDTRIVSVMSEGRFWKCTWSSTEGLYKAWVIARPKLAGTGKDWESAVNAMCDMIADVSGDCEPVLSFDPVEPGSSSDDAYLKHDWTLLTWNSHVQLADFEARLFDHGCCSYCRYPIGRRNPSHRLRAEGPAAGDICGPHYFAWSKYDPVMFSESAIEALAEDERSCFEWIPVEPAPRTKRRLLEAIPKELVPRVAIQGWANISDRCPKCKDIDIGVSSQREVRFDIPQVHEWTSCSLVEKSKLPIRGFGKLTDWQMLIDKHRCKQLLRDKRIRGARAYPLGIVPDSMVASNPVYRKRFKET